MIDSVLLRINKLPLYLRQRIYDRGDSVLRVTRALAASYFTTVRNGEIATDYAALTAALVAEEN